jgi:thiamine-monophosphate kinase
LTDATPLAPGREFDAIRDLLERWGPRARGIGDDAAVLDLPPGEHLVVSTDNSVENVHFRRSWLSPREIGYRATAAGLSDLAAMAATPRGILVTLAVPDNWRGELGQLGEGIGEAANDAGALIVGGDLTSASELTVGITVLGSTLAPLRRSGARVGDRICVTGTLGGPGRAVRDLSAGRTPDAVARARFAHPVPRIREARWLGQHGCTAAIDISDGVASDAMHIAAASGVHIILDLDRLPRLDGVDPLQAAASGEEYELLVAIPPSAAVHDFERSFRLPLTEIGRIVAGGPPRVETRIGGLSVAPPRGYDHFS